MTTERKKRLTIVSCILCGTIVCALFFMRHGAYQHAFRLGLDAFMLINFWVSYRYNLNRPQRDTLLHLFPVQPETSTERC